MPINKGHFSVLLGQVTALNVDWSKSLWLTIQVGTDPELLPRQRITSVPLAVRAEVAESLTTALTPSLITPQGSGSGLDADTVDGKHAPELLDRANHTGTQPSSTIMGTFAPSRISPQGSSSGFDADPVDGQHANAFARAGTCTAYPREEYESYASCPGGSWELVRWCSGNCDGDDAKVTICCAF